MAWIAHLLSPFLPVDEPTGRMQADWPGTLTRQCAAPHRVRPFPLGRLDQLNRPLALTICPCGQHDGLRLGQRSGADVVFKLGELLGLPLGGSQAARNCLSRVWGTGARPVRKDLPQVGTGAAGRGCTWCCPTMSAASGVLEPAELTSRRLFGQQGRRTRHTLV